MVHILESVYFQNRFLERQIWYLDEISMKSDPNWEYINTGPGICHQAQSH